MGNQWHVLAGDKIFRTEDSSFYLHDLGTAGTSALSLFKKDDTLLVGTLRGIQFLKEKKNSLHPIGFVEYNAGVSSMLHYKKQFIAGTYGSGLIQFQPNGLQQQTNDYPFRIIEKLVPLSSGFAALSYEDGLLLTNSATNKHTQLNQVSGLLSNSVYTLFEKGQNLYIGMKGGLSIYSNGKVKQTFRFPGRFVQEKAIACFADVHRRMWVVSNHLLYEVKEDGLKPVASYPLIGKDDVITTATYNTSTNEVGIGSNKSFSIVSLNAIRRDTIVPLPRLMQVLVDGNVQPAADFIVPFNFQKIQFEAAPLSSLPFTQTHFYYRLEGLSDEWNEVKDSLKISFSGLRSGNYLLWFKTVNADGFESTPVKLVVFSVQKPFWLRWYMVVIWVVSIISLTVYAVRQIEKEKRRKKEAALFLQQSLQAERSRIAKDLHDHLGANLATIIAQTDNIESRLYKGDVVQAGQTVQSLSSQTRETMNVLRETVWAVQEKEHTLQEFVIRVRMFLQRLFEPSGLAWEVKNHCDPGLILSPSQTLHLFRIIQEASQNILKHANASAANYTVACNNRELCITIQDDGKGFKKNHHKTNGLLNMQERAVLLGGTLIIKDLPASIIVSIPV